MLVKLNRKSTRCLNNHEILQQYQEGRRDFRRVNLSGQSFQAQNLSGADFSEADLRGANFSRANLKNTQFTGAIAGLARMQRGFFWLQCGWLSVLWGASFAFLSLWVVGFSFIPERLQDDIAAPILGLLFIELLVSLFLISFRKGIFIGITALTFDLAIFMMALMSVDDLNFYLTIPMIILAIGIALSVPLSIFLANKIILNITAATMIITVAFCVVFHRLDALSDILAGLVAIVVFCGIFTIGIFTFAAATAQGLLTFVSIGAIAAALSLGVTVAGAIPYTVSNDIYFELYSLEFDVDDTFFPLIGFALLAVITLTLVFGTVLAIAPYIPNLVSFVLYSGSSLLMILSWFWLKRQPLLATISPEQIQTISVGFRTVFIILGLGLIAAVLLAITGYITATFAIAFATAIAFAMTGYVPVAIAMLMVTVLLSMSMYMGWHTYKDSQHNAWIRRCAIAFAAAEGTSFRKADLTDANFSQAQLHNTDLRGAIVEGVHWQDTQGLNSVRLDQPLGNSRSPQ